MPCVLLVAELVLGFTSVFVLCFPDLLLNCSLGSKAVVKYLQFYAV